MRLPQIRMESQPALISIQTQNATQTIQQPKADQEILQPKAEITIRTTPSRLTIDQSKAWHDMGLRTAKQLHEDATRQGYQKVMQGISRRVREGTEQMKIENGGDPLLRQAVNNANRPEKQFNIGWVPSPFAVDIDYQPSDVHIDVRANAPIINNRPNKPVIQYQPGYAETGIRQEADLHIDFENLYFRGFQFEMSI
ncbi:hypothetical protein J2T56_001550 [Natronobacillus azotifigens]|uniref:DUF6470 family protein n=1 Tax=Natronobacillus azotifigens TaxID=472978 RepID=A0A9J6R9Z6_9BACI|nr:DUF6470 family protein [Natronobacillus azotifigens]MCZ0702116.1 DUF6470 family protein [Natronobacillus azotifigens]